jgi:hypothetical protein
VSSHGSLSRRGLGSNLLGAVPDFAAIGLTLSRLQELCVHALTCVFVLCGAFKFTGRDREIERERERERERENEEMARGSDE